MLDFAAHGPAFTLTKSQVQVLLRPPESFWISGGTVDGAVESLQAVTIRALGEVFRGVGSLSKTSVSAPRPRGAGRCLRCRQMLPGC
jgi:hypothetical protein